MLFQLKMLRPTLQRGIVFTLNIAEFWFIFFIIVKYCLFIVVFNNIQMNKFLKFTFIYIYIFCYYVLLFCLHRSFNVLVKDLDGKNHQMTVKNLLFPIIVAESSKKVCHFLFLYIGKLICFMDKIVKIKRQL